NVRNHMPMPQRISFLCYLPLIKMHLPVPFTSKIVLVLPPCDTSHKVGRISSVAPSLNTLFKSHVSFPVMIFHTVNNCNVCPYVDYRLPWIRSLKNCFFIKRRKRNTCTRFSLLFLLLRWRASLKSKRQQ